MSKKSTFTKQQILSSALSLIHNSNLHKVTMTDVAVSAGISRQALYKHFATRIDLFIDLLKSIDNEQILLDEILNDESFSIKERLKSFIDYWGSNNQATYFVYSEIKLFIGVNQKAKNLLEEKERFFREQCEKMIRILNDGGLLKSNFTLHESVDILCNLLSETTWAFFQMNCTWTQSQYLNKIHEIIGQLLISTSTKSAWSISGY